VIFLTASDSRDVSMAVFDQEMPCASIFSQVINRLLSNDVFLRIIEEKWDTLIFSKVLSEPTEPGQQRLLSMIKFFAPDGQLTDKESFLAFLFYMLVNPAFLGCDFVFGFVLPLFLNCIKNIDFANNMTPKFFRATILSIQVIKNIILSTRSLKNTKCR